MTTKTRSGVQCVHLEFGSDAGFAMVHCPACGKAAVGPEGEPGDCAHLLFVYLASVGEFEYLREDFRRRCEDRPEVDWSPDEFCDQLGALDYDQRLLVVELRRKGMACGPVGSVELYGFALD